MVCSQCQEEVWVTKYLSHRIQCRKQQSEKEIARMRRLAIERLREPWIIQNRKSKGNAA
jgi:hypothetical protein